MATPVPDENLQDTGVPGIVTGTPTLTDYGTYAVNNIVIQPDDSGNTNVVGATEIALGLYYVDELATDLWASIDSALDAATDPAPGGLHCQSGHCPRVQGGRLRGRQRRGCRLPSLRSRSPALSS